MNERKRNRHFKKFFAALMSAILLVGTCWNQAALQVSAEEPEPFGPTDDRPYFIELLTEGIGHVDVPEGYPEEDYFRDNNMLQIRSATSEIVVDVYTNDDPEVEHNITGIYRHFEEPENPESAWDDSYSYEKITQGQCSWASYNENAKKMTFTLSDEDKQFWGIFVTFEGPGFGPTDDRPYFIELLTEGIGHVDVPEGYPEEDYFRDNNMLQIRSATSEIVVDVYTNDDPEVEHNITGIYRHFEEPENPESAWDDSYSYEKITQGQCSWASYNENTKKMTFTLSDEDKQFWGVFVTFEGPGFGPSDDRPYFIELFTEGIGHVDVPEGYPEEDYFRDNNMLQIRSATSEIVVDVYTNDDPEVEHNITEISRHFEDPGDPESAWDDSYSYEKITQGQCSWASYNTGTKKITFSLSEGDKEFWGVNVRFSGNIEPGGGNHNIDVDFAADMDGFNGDAALEFTLDINACQGDGGKISLEESGLVFGKNKDQNYSFHLSVPDNAVSLAFHLTTVEGSKLDNVYYKIEGEVDPHNLSSEQMQELMSDVGFKVSIKDGESWKGKLTFGVRIVDDNPGGGGQGGDMDVTYSEATTLSENTTKNDVKVENATLTIGENCSLRIDHRVDVEGTGAIVGTSNTSKLVFTKGAFSYGLDLYCNDEKISGGSTNSFNNQSEGPSEFTWDSSSNRWVTDNDPTGGGGTDAPWYTVSYGNSANLTTKNGQVYAERVHVNSS